MVAIYTHLGAKVEFSSLEENINIGFCLGFRVYGK